METVPPASPTRGDLTYKIVVIGSAAVGKTNLLSVAARGQQFNERSPPTLEPEFVTVKVPRPDWKFGEPNQFLRAQVWDTAGQERFQAISSSHYRRANGALIVYDVSNRQSFKDVFPGTPGGNQWLRSLKDNSDPSLLAAVMLVENKVDKLGTKTAATNERPSAFVQDEQTQRLLSDTVITQPKVGWLEEASSSETVPYRIANSLIFARTSALTNQCELFELTEQRTESGPDLLALGRAPGALKYEVTPAVTTVAQAIEALMLRIYARSADMSAGGSKPSGKRFSLHDSAAVETNKSGGCC